MNEYLQSGYHPDADQISAFVEHALSAHEREQMFAHLAVCPECRAVVALSLPEVEEPAKPVTVPARRAWWSGWVLAWPAAAALAACAALFFYVHHATITAPAPAANQVAVSHPPAEPGSAAQSSSARPAQALSHFAAPPTRRRPTTSMEGGSAAAKANPYRATGAQEMAAKESQPRPIDSFERAAQAASNPSAEYQGQSMGVRAVARSGASSGTGSGSAPGIGANPSMDARSRIAQAAPPETARALSRSAPAAPAAVPMAHPGLGATETVEVSNAAAPIETVSADAGSFTIAQNEARNALNELQVAQFKHPLPSRLPVLSVAAQARHVLAIDIHNAVFLSKDSGKHWRAIRAPWQGRAVQASLVESPAEKRTAFSRAKAANMASVSAGNAASPGITNGALVVQNRSIAGLAGSSLTGTVTDMTGAIIAGAAVSVTDTASHTTRTVKTDGSGRYVVEALAPGTYKVEAQARGFNTQSFPNVTIAESRKTVANLSLSVGAATETVTVEAASKEISASEAARAPSPASSPPAPLFQITTDNGERWTSTDGVNWKPM